MQLYDEMKEEDSGPNTRTIGGALQACCIRPLKSGTLVDGLLLKKTSLQGGRVKHADAVRMGYDTAGNSWSECT